MIKEEIIHGGDNKSYLRKKWDKVFYNIVSKRVPEIYKNNGQVLKIDKEEDLKNLIDKNNFQNNKKWKVIIISVPLNNFINLVNFFDKLDATVDEETKIIVNYYSIIWKPFFALFSFFGLINNYKSSLFFSKNTLEIFLRTGNFEVSKNLNNFFIPLQVPFISKLFSIFFNFLPFFNNLNITNIFYIRKKNRKINEQKKMSLIIPCKNEEGNIEKIISEAKKHLTFSYELVFIDDKSSDKTLDVMTDCKNANPDIEIKITKGLGEGKAKAIDEGIKIASGYYSIIFDADLTVGMPDMNLFYSAINNHHADLINGSRLVYKPYSGAMKFLNFLGNIFFSKLASYVTGEKITDTLCGSKCFVTDNYKIFNEFKQKNDIHDIWGDFNILYSSNFYGLKCIDLPVRYYERTEGETKMRKRLFFFFNMLLTSVKALIRFKINFDK
jgi:hypothetical protein